MHELDGLEQNAYIAPLNTRIASKIPNPLVQVFDGKHIKSAVIPSLRILEISNLNVPDTSINALQVVRLNHPSLVIKLSVLVSALALVSTALAETCRFPFTGYQGECMTPTRYLSSRQV